MYLFIIYGDLEHNNIIFVGLFDRLKDIIEFTNNLIRYSDIKKEKSYKSYKNLFRVIKC